MVFTNKKRQRQENSKQPKVSARGELHEVEWLDAFEESSGWHSVEDALKIRPKPVISSGYLLWQDESKIILAADVDPKLKELLKKEITLEKLFNLIKKTNLDGSDCGRIQAIPSGWIVNKREVK